METRTLNFVMRVLLKRYDEITVTEYDNDERPTTTVARKGFEQEVCELKVALKSLLREVTK